MPQRGIDMYCAKHNTATFHSPTCRVCELEAFAARLSELLQAYQQKKTDSYTDYATMIALAKANEYGLIRKQ